MKTLLSLAILSCWVSCAFAQNPRLFFASPTAGDLITSGQSVNLKWFTTSNSSGNVRISFWNQSIGQWSDVGTTGYKSGTYQWNAPEIYGKSFRLRGITDNGVVMYSSGFFSIQPPAAKVESKVPGLTSEIVCTVHPNPAVTSAKVCVEQLPDGVPATVEIVDALGEHVTTLYNATPEGDMGLCMTLDCSRLSSGTYYARVMNDVMGRAVKLSVEH